LTQKNILKPKLKTNHTCKKHEKPEMFFENRSKPKKKNNEHEEYIDEHSNQIQQYELESKPEFMK
jgi:hypothetical protein